MSKLAPLIARDPDEHDRAATTHGAGIAASIDEVTAQASAGQHEVSKWLGASLALGPLALWVTRDRVLTLRPPLKAPLPVMAVCYLVAGVFGQPVRVFALLCVLTVLWCAPRPGGTRAAAA